MIISFAISFNLIIIAFIFAATNYIAINLVSTTDPMLSSNFL